MKQYKFKKDLPGIKAGKIIKTEDMPHVVFTMPIGQFIKDYPEWVEEIDDCLDDWITIGVGRMDDGRFYLTKNEGENFSNKEVDKIRKCINGELYSIKDICKLYADWQRLSDGTNTEEFYLPYGEVLSFTHWLKQRKK